MSADKPKTEAEAEAEKFWGEAARFLLRLRGLAHQADIEREARTRARTQMLLRENTVLPIPQMPTGKGSQTNKAIAILWTWPAADLMYPKRVLTDKRLKDAAGHRVAGRNTILNALKIVKEARV